MKTMIAKYLGALLLTMTTMTTFTSCIYDDLFYKVADGERVQLRLDVDWKDFTQEVPTGMTVMIYDTTMTTVQTLRSNDITHVSPSLTVGRYHAIAFNQTPSEFGTIQFRNLDSFHEAMVCTLESRSTWYRSRSDDGGEGGDEMVGQDVEWFATQSLQPPYELTGLLSESDLTKGLSMGTIYPQPVVYTVKVKVRIPGYASLRSARASLSGMAYGCYLATGQTTATTATQLLESWTLEEDSVNTSDGYILATIHCFGLPADFIGNAKDNVLALSLLLQDKTTQLDHNFSVGDQWQQDPADPYTLWLNLTWPSKLPTIISEGGNPSGAGFSVKVDDWGPETVIETPVE